MTHILASQGSRSAARYFASRRFLDRPLPRPVRVLPRAADYLKAVAPLGVCPDPWPIIQARARVDLARLNEAVGRNRKGGAR